MVLTLKFSTQAAATVRLQDLPTFSKKAPGMAWTKGSDRAAFTDERMVADVEGDDNKQIGARNWRNTVVHSKFLMKIRFLSVYNTNVVRP